MDHKKLESLEKVLELKKILEPFGFNISKSDQDDYMFDISHESRDEIVMISKEYAVLSLQKIIKKSMEIYLKNLD